MKIKNARDTITLIVLILATLGSGLSSSGCGRKTERPNIVLVVLDTVRADAAGLGEVRPEKVGVSTGPADDGAPDGARGGSFDSGSRWQGLTPNLKRLGREGAVFTHAFAAAPWTVPSHASMFTGHLPSSHGCTFANPHLDPGLPTAARLLAESGYETASFFSVPWLADRVSGLLNGFTVKEESPIGDLSTLTADHGDQGGIRTLGNIASWLERRTPSQPFFLFVNLFEAHLPYDPPAEYRHRHLANNDETGRVTIDWCHEFNAGLYAPQGVDWWWIDQLYGGDVNTADALLGQLMELLTKHGLNEETIFIITSDHGENIGDHGLMEHQYSVHETLLAVPLVIRAPGTLIKHGIRSEPVLTTDLFTTLLDAAGIMPEEPPPHSRSLLRPPATDAGQRPLISEYAGPQGGLVGLLTELNPLLDVLPMVAAKQTVRVGTLRLTTSNDGEAVLHEMSSDPGQETDLSKEYPDVVRWLSGFLPKPSETGSPARHGALNIDEATRKQLKELGYLR